MWEAYKHATRHYQKLSLLEERQLILKAQRGAKKSKDELVLRIENRDMSGIGDAGSYIS